MSIASTVLPYLPLPAQNAVRRVKASPLGYRLASGAIWSISGAVISRALMLLANIIVARMLTREVYGELGIIRSTVNMFVVFAGFGMGLTATKHVAEFRQSDPARAGRIMALSSAFTFFTGALIAVILFFAAPWLAGLTLNAPHLATELRISGLILLVSAMNGAQTGALAGFEAFKTIAGINLRTGLISFPIFIAGAWLGGLHGSVWALGASMAVNWFLNHLALRKESSKHSIPFSFADCTREWPILWKFSLPAVLSGVMVSPVVWLCNAMLVNQPGGYGEMALFDAANQWRAAILFVPGMLGQIVLPMLSSLNGPGEQAKYLKVLKINVLTNGGTALVVSIPIALAAPWIMKTYGSDFETGRSILVCLAFSTVIMSINNIVGQSIASKGRMWIGFFFNALWAATLLFASHILIRGGHGALGVAMANLFAYLVHSLWQTIYILRFACRAK